MAPAGAAISVRRTITNDGMTRRVEAEDMEIHRQIDVIFMRTAISDTATRCRQPLKMVRKLKSDYIPILIVGASLTALLVLAVFLVNRESSGAVAERRTGSHPLRIHPERRCRGPQCDQLCGRLRREWGNDRADRRCP